MNDFCRLKCSLDEILIPFLHEKKWRRELEPKVKVGAQISAAFPFGRFTREKNGEMHLLEIQMDKRRRPRFIINFGVVPVAGVSLPWGHFKAAEVTVSSLPEAGRLYASRFFLSWFAFPPFSFGVDASVLSDRLVRRAVILYPEIEGWYLTRSFGRHIRIFGHPNASS